MSRRRARELEALLRRKLAEHPECNIPHSILAQLWAAKTQKYRMSVLGEALQHPSRLRYPQHVALDTASLLLGYLESNSGRIK